MTHRLYFLDWARIAALGVLMLFHTGMYYVTWDWHVKSPVASDALEPFMMMSSPWRLGLLFFVSGAATSFLLRGGTRGFLRPRSRRLLWPLLFGMAVIVPPQSYLEVVEKVHYDGSYLDFLGLYFRAYHGFCRGTDCLILPTWNHLWFLAYLWVYTFLLWLLVRCWPQALQVLGERASRALRGAGWLLWPAAFLGLVRVAFFGRFPVTHALVDDVYSHALYLPLFLFGAVLARCPAAWPALARWRWPALALSVAAWAALMVYFHVYAVVMPPHWQLMVERSAFGCLQWGPIVAVLGFGWRHWNRDHRWRATLNEAVFPVYVLHQTVIVVLAHSLKPLHWPPVPEGLFIVACTFALSFGGYLVARRIAWLRPWMGMAPARRDPLARPAPGVGDGPSRSSAA